MKMHNEIKVGQTVEFLYYTLDVGGGGCMGFGEIATISKNGSVGLHTFDADGRPVRLFHPDTGIDLTDRVRVVKPKPKTVSQREAIKMLLDKAGFDVEVRG